MALSRRIVALTIPSQFHDVSLNRRRRRYKYLCVSINISRLTGAPSLLDLLVSCEISIKTRKISRARQVRRRCKTNLFITAKYLALDGRYRRCRHPLQTYRYLGRWKQARPRCMARAWPMHRAHPRCCGRTSTKIRLSRRTCPRTRGTPRTSRRRSSAGSINRIHARHRRQHARRAATALPMLGIVPSRKKRRLDRELPQSDEAGPSH